MSPEALYALLRCPRSGAPLVREGDYLVSCDAEARWRYPIVDEIPIMLSDEAEPVSPEEWAAIMRHQGRAETPPRRNA